MEGFACFDCICVHPPPCHIQSFKPFVLAFIYLDLVGLPPTLRLTCSHVQHNDLFSLGVLLTSILPLQPSVTFLFTVPFIQDMQCKMWPM